VIDREKAQDWCDRFSSPYRRAGAGTAAAVATLDDAIYYAYGDVDPARPSPPDADTLFEIGSLTKVFTAILLAKMVVDGRLDPDAPIADIDPVFAGAPAWITPRRLSTHTAGLPRLPVGLLDRRAWCFYFAESRFNPYPKFLEEAVIDWLRAYRPRRAPPPGRFQYSNLGVGLLGLLLGRLGGGNYEQVLAREALDPLGLKDTRATLTPEQAARFASPRRGDGTPAPLWDFPGLAGAGALRATARDLVQFGRATILAARGEGPLAAAIQLTLAVQIPSRHAFAPSMCLGWSVMPTMVSKLPIYHHDGGTFGAMSSFFVCPEAGFVILSLANRGLSAATAIKQIRADPAGQLRDMVAAFG
jgi:serine-type D-Ala-D-Ala carboxypeptidase/endopeptidase